MNFLSTLWKNNVFTICIFPLKTRAKLFVEIFSYEILKSGLNQTRFSYRSYSNIFTLRCDVSNSIKNSFKKFKEHKISTNFTLVM